MTTRLPSSALLFPIASLAALPAAVHADTFTSASTQVMAGGSGRYNGTGTVTNGDARVSDRKEGPIKGGSTMADSWAWAEPGALHGRAEAVADVWANEASTVAYAEAAATFNDYIKIDSTQWPIGTSVTLTFTQHIDGAILGSNGFRGIAESGLGISGTTMYPVTSNFVEWDYRYDPDPNKIGSGKIAPAPVVVTAKVGSTIGISGWLRVQAMAGNGLAPGGSVVAGYGNTVRYFGRSSLDGVSLVGSNGHNYAAPVPEPASLGALAVGLAALRRRGPKRS